MMIAEHRIAPPAETVEGHRYGNRHVHTNHADLDIGDEGTRTRTALGEYRGTVGILVPVDEFDGGAIVGNTHDAEHRTEVLLAINSHVGTHRVEQRRPEEEAV